MAEETSSVIHLGSNLGNRTEFLNKAIDRLEMLGKVVKRSAIYETAPWGVTDQPFFLNMAVELITSMAPAELLKSLRLIETELGRTRQQKWGPRTIDMDLIFYGDKIIETEELTVPHPQAHKRAFVLIPLLDICPDRIHPKFNQKVWELYDQCTDVTEVYLPDVPL